MSKSVPDFIAAWAKVHDGTVVFIKAEVGPDHWRVRTVMPHGKRSIPVPSADSNDWLAGMVRAMSTHDGLEIEPPDEQGDWLCYWQKGFALRRRHGYAPTLEAAIIAAVLGDDDAT